jgi:hypothetical protein
LAGKNYAVDLENQTLMKKGADGEFEDTKGKNNRELL